MDISGATGFELKTDQGWILDIGNEWLGRRIYCIAGRIGTISLIHGASGEEYLEGVNREFAITVSKDGNERELNFTDFLYTGHALMGDDSEKLLKIDLSADVDGTVLPVSVFYQAKASENVMRKWIEIHSAELPGWVIEQVVIEDLKFPETVEAIYPRRRYPQAHPNGEDNVQVSPEDVDTSSNDEWFTFGQTGRSIVAPWGLSEGLFFFTQHLLGEESFDRGRGLLMVQKDYVAVSEGLTTGPAVIGAYSGEAEIGFKRYNEYLAKNWCVVDSKSTPVCWNTWFITSKNGQPLMHDYDKRTLSNAIDYMKRAEFYDVLHLDLGWEAGVPLRVDDSKFSNGLGEIVQKAKDSGLEMGFWVNPFSSSYWKSDIETEHANWLVPGATSPESGAHAICPLTDYSVHVKDRLVDLVKNYNARLIYWDGGDWNINSCSAEGHDHSNPKEYEVKVKKQLSSLADSIHAARPDSLIVNFSLPFDNHRLAVVDKEQVSDSYQYQMIESVLIQRQQIFQMTFEHPYSALWGSWYGINWINNGPDNLARPLRELQYALMSMIGNGLNQAGGSIDPEQARPEIVELLRRIIVWRKRFEKYFMVYQHILGFPDGKSVDGEGHIIDGKGFIILNNPTDEEKTVKLPLEESELELPVGKAFEITDWSGFEEGRPLGKTRIGAGFDVDMMPLSVKVVGVNIDK